MNEHVSNEILAAYVDGRLEKGQRPEVETHLSRCRECRQALADVLDMLANREMPPAEFLRQGLKASAAGDTGPQALPGKRPLLLRPAFGVAAVFLVAVIAGFFFLGRGRMELPQPGEREMAQQPAARGEATTPLRDEAAPPIAPAPEKAVGDRSDAARPRAGSGPGLKKKLAAETPVAVPPPALSEAAPVAQPVERELPRQADKGQPARYNGMDEGVSGGALGGVEAREEEVRDREIKAVFAQKAMPCLAGNGTSMAAARGSHSTMVLNAASGALQVFLAANGRAAAPPNLGMVELAAEPLVRIAGDVAGGDLLVPGLQDVREWLPEGLALQVTIGADGRVAAVKLLGEWEPGAAERAKKAAGRMVFSPARQDVRRAILSRDPLTR